MNLNAHLGEGTVVPDALIPFAAAITRYTGLSRSTAERLAARGEIKVVRIGRRVLVAESELRRFVAAARASVGAAA